jgi:hypothetical protein|eukprot:7380512-Prymnesium_polylepis.2
MDLLEKRLWAPKARPGAGLTYVDYTNHEISIGMELRKLFNSVDSMVKAVKGRVDSHATSDIDDDYMDETFMDVVDEIYLTEQMCNFFYGVRYLVDKKRLGNGEWVAWKDDLEDKVRANSFEIRTGNYYALPPDVRTYVLYPDLIDRVWSIVTQLMETCIAVDFRLPYLRIKELRAIHVQRDGVWPGLGAGTVSPQLKPRLFPDAMNV